MLWLSGTSVFTEMDPFTPFFFFQYDVQNTRGAFGIVLGRWVGDHLNAFDHIGGDGTQGIALLVGQHRGLTIYQYLHPGTAPQADAVPQCSRSPRVRC